MNIKVGASFDEMCYLANSFTIVTFDPGLVPRTWAYLSST
jgi:hypothetical protein